jgi:hypothetical protein
MSEWPRTIKVEIHRIMMLYRVKKERWVKCSLSVNRSIAYISRVRMTKIWHLHPNDKNENESNNNIIQATYIRLCKSLN